MQNCTHCHIPLIISITGELLDNGTNSPDIVCKNCGQVNEAAQAAYTDKPTFDCVMCGQEWETHMRSDGRYYCARCWQVWNS